jgi:hypothetical protein
MVSLGMERVLVSGESCEVESHATLFDFGVVSVRLHLALPGPLPWPRLAELVGSLAGHPELEIAIVLLFVLDIALALLRD